MALVSEVLGFQERDLYQDRRNDSKTGPAIRTMCTINAQMLCALLMRMKNAALNQWSFWAAEKIVCRDQ